MLPMNALVAPGLFRLKVRNNKQDAFIRSDDVLISFVAIQLRKFYERKIPMAALENYLVEMEKAPSLTWEKF